MTAIECALPDDLALAAAMSTVPSLAATVVDQLLSRVRWTLEDAAHLELAVGDRVDEGGALGPFIVVLSGEVRVRLDDDVWQLRAGDVLLRTRPAAVELQALDGADLVVASLRHVDDGGHPLLNLLPEALVVCRLLASESHVRGLADMLVAELAGGRPGSTLLAQSIAGLLAAAALRAWVESGRAPDGWLTCQVDADIARVVDAIRNDPGATWTLERLARLAHTSRSAFMERFRSAMEDSPARYLARVRMERAKSMLSADGASVAQVAARSGYGSDAAFSRAFFRHTGIRPSAWRQGAGATVASR